MTWAADSHPSLQLLLAVMLFKMRSTMHLARDKVMKAQISGAPAERTKVI